MFAFVSTPADTHLPFHLSPPIPRSIGHNDFGASATSEPCRDFGASALAAILKETINISDQAKQAVRDAAGSGVSIEF